MTRVMTLSVCATLWLVTFAMFSNPQKVNSAVQPSGASPAQKFAELSDQFMKDSLRSLPRVLPRPATTSTWTQKPARQSSWMLCWTI